MTDSDDSEEPSRSSADEPAEGPYEARPAWSDYEFTTEPTVWRLVWADERYRGGVIDDEAAFLDEENALPS